MLKVLPAPKERICRFPDLSGGLNLEDLEYNVLDSQSPDCKNVWFNGRMLCKRWGTKNLNTSALSGSILGIYQYFYKGYIIFASGSQIYKMNPSTGSMTSIYSGLTASKGKFLYFNGKLYYINGTQFVVYDGTTASDLTQNAYVPTIVINRTPTGGGSTHATSSSIEDINRIQPLVKISFNGDGTSKAYSLFDQNIDSTTVTCTVGGVTKVENTDFTVNRTTGVVTFTTAPTSGQNNVIITYGKTYSVYVNSILNCTFMESFGGPGETRVFFGGNGTPYYYWSSASLPDYIPASQYNLWVSSDDRITAFAKQDDALIMFCAHSIGAVTYKYDDTTATAYFPFYNINTHVGCDCPATITMVYNRLTWLTSYTGVYTLINELNTGSSTYTYRSIAPVSRNINGSSRASGLLQESNLTSAVAVEFAQKYWIAINGHVYLWDYAISPYVAQENFEKAQLPLSWWYFEDLPITCFVQDGANLYFGDSGGNIRHFENSFADNYIAPGPGKNLFNPAPVTLTAGAYTATNLTSYTPGTWAEFTKTSGVTGDSTGLTFTADGVNVQRATHSFVPSPSQKYMLLYYVISSTASPSKLFIGSSFNGTSIPIPQTVGNHKVVATSGTNPTAFNIPYTVDTAGNAIKIKDARIFALPSGSQIESDSTSLTDDQLAAKYLWCNGSEVIGGVTCTVGEDQQPILNGTAMVDGEFTLDTDSLTMQNGLPYVASETVVSGSASGSNASLTFHPSPISSGDMPLNISGAGQQIASMSIGFHQGAVFNNYKVGIQLEQNSTAAAWEEYLTTVQHADPISAHWKMKINHLGEPNVLKTVKKIWLSCRTDTATTLNITYYTDNQPDGIVDAQPIYIASFDWSNFDWSNFIWGINNWFGEWRKVPPMKSVIAFSLMFSNSNVAEDLNVSDIIVSFINVKEVRRSV